MIERGRELARLQASGVGLGTLRAATAVEQIGPLALGVAGATLAGVAEGATFVLLPPTGPATSPSPCPGAGWPSSPCAPPRRAAAVLAVTLPVLAGALRPEAPRAEWPG